MGSHVFVLPDKAIGLTCPINRAISTIRLSKVREEAVLKTSLGWLVGKENGGRGRTGELTYSRAVVTIVIIWTIYHTYRRLNISVKSWVLGTAGNTSPS